MLKRMAAVCDVWFLFAKQATDECDGGINVLWLLPIAFAVTEGRIDGFVGVLIAYTPLTIAALIFGAGTPSTN